MRLEVGKPISDIVRKLLSKNAEDRYQGAYHFYSFSALHQLVFIILNLFIHLDCRGLMADLREVERARKQQTPLVDFVAGAHDQLRRLHVSQKLYGREDEVRRLTHNFELVCEGSPVVATLVLVHGYSGVL